MAAKLHFYYQRVKPQWLLHTRQPQNGTLRCPQAARRSPASSFRGNRDRPQKASKKTHAPRRKPKFRGDCDAVFSERACRSPNAGIYGGRPMRRSRSAKRGSEQNPSATVLANELLEARVRPQRRKIRAGIHCRKVAIPYGEYLLKGFQGLFFLAASRVGRA